MTTTQATWTPGLFDYLVDSAIDALSDEEFRPSDISGNWILSQTAWSLTWEEETLALGNALREDLASQIYDALQDWLSYQDELQDRMDWELSLRSA